MPPDGSQPHLSCAFFVEERYRFREQCSGLLRFHKWRPVAQAMPRVLKELDQQPDLGLLHAKMGFSRTILRVQHWRSMEQLLAYAKNKDAAHLPAWRAYNKASGTDR